MPTPFAPCPGCAASVLRRALTRVLLTAVVATTLGSSRLAEAQQLRGTVLFADSTTPAASVMVQVIGSSGNVVTRLLTTSTGAFQVNVPNVGRFGLRILRIGFEPTDIPPLPVSLGAGAPLTIVLRSAPVVLPTLGVRVRRSERSCRERPDSALAVFRVWEEAAKALAASELTAANSGLSVQWLTFRRMLMREDSTLYEDDVVRRSGRTPRPFRSAPADELEHLGYRRVVNGQDAYLAPDAQVLLSPNFFTGHCFRLRESAEHPQWVGAEFEPLTAREKIVDIAGTAWIDRTSAELRVLDFQYTGVAKEVAQVGTAGRIEYVRLPDGAFVIGRWQVRLPSIQVIEKELHEYGSMRNDFKVTVIGTSTSGGELERARLGDTEQYALADRTSTVRLTGGSPMVDVRGATLAFAGEAGYLALSDSLGVARLLGIPVGEHSLGITTSAMRDLIAKPLLRRVRFGEGGGERDVSLTITESELVSAACGAGAAKRGDAVVFGTVRDLNNEPIANDTIEVRWTQKLRREIDAVSDDMADSRGERMTTDDLGRWKACGVTRPSYVAVFRKKNQERVEIGRVEVTPDKQFVRLSLRLRP